MTFKLLINIVILVTFIFIIIKVIKSNSTILQKLLKIVLSIIIIWIIMFSTDYILTQNQKLPLFCTNLNNILMYMDGGTVEYWGVGYKVFDFHKIVGGEPKWDSEGIFELEYKYICTWSTSYKDALYKVQEKYFSNK